ncbi:hypothetical protein MesoLj131b_00920 [Mesorhizobium sp. 131-2-5]|nr:hypothetical protein MesoLj131b_00920 [Mesorhizobium sp. 131-2-5]
MSLHPAKQGFQGRAPRVPCPIDKVKAVAGQNDIADSQKTAIAKLPCNEHVATQPKTLSGYDRFDPVVLFVEFQLRWPDGAANSVARRSGRSLPVTPGGRTYVGHGPPDLDTWQVEDRLRLDHADASLKNRRRPNDVERIAK